MQFCSLCFSYIFVSSLEVFIDVFGSPVERWLILCFFCTAHSDMIINLNKQMHTVAEHVWYICLLGLLASVT
jgi:hypothetical protein